MAIQGNGVGGFLVNVIEGGARNTYRFSAAEETDARDFVQLHARLGEGPVEAWKVSAAGKQQKWFPLKAW